MKTGLWKEQVAGKLYHARWAVTGLMMSMAARPCQSLFFAETEKKDSNDYDFLTGKSANNVFGGLNTTAKDAGASIYSLLRTIGIIGLLVSIIVVGVTLAVSKNAQAKEQNKAQVLWIAVGGCFIFGAMGLIGILSGMGSSIK